MGFQNLLRHKGLAIATLILVLLVLFFLGAVQTISHGAVKQTESLAGLQRIESSLALSTSPSTLQGLARQLEGLDLKNQASVSIVTNSLASADTASARQGIEVLLNEAMMEKERKTQLAKYLAIIAAIVTVLFAGLVMLPLIARITQSENTQVETRKEAEGIMSTVNEGLFLLGDDHTIGVEQSASLKNMFRSDRDLEGNFFDFIGHYVPASTVQVAKDYLDLLFGDRVKEKLVQDLNPLNEVEISIARRDGSFESRFLNFRFNRVLADGKLSHLLGSVTDVTREVTLQRELVESREEQEAQLDLLMSILHVDSAQLSNFFSLAEASLSEINQTLESKGYSDADIRKKLQGISEKTHRLKGDAAALGLHRFEFSAHALEEELQRVQKTGDRITGKELLPSVTCLKELFADLQNMRSLVAKFAGSLGQASGGANPDTASADRPTESSLFSPLEQSLQTLSNTVCERAGKRANLQIYGLGKNAEIPERLRDVVSSSAVQLIRNSIVHGALTPAERIASGKSDFINITTSFTRTEKGYALLVRDDGEGLDDAAIIKKAVDLGLFSQDAAAKLAPGSAAKIIFQPGFSAKDDADLDGGRGVGLNAVYSMVRELGGNVSLRQNKGAYCQFQMLFPLESS